MMEPDVLPIHTEVWDKLNKQAEEIHHLRRANRRLRDEVRGLRKYISKKQKELDRKEPYRNGQKRGRTRNG